MVAIRSYDNAARANPNTKPHANTGAHIRANCDCNTNSRTDRNSDAAAIPFHFSFLNNHGNC
jgi:hypothetical protein